MSRPLVVLRSPAALVSCSNTVGPTRCCRGSVPRLLPATALAVCREALDTLAVLFTDHSWSMSSSHHSTRSAGHELGCCLLFLLYLWLWAQPNFTCMNLQMLGKR